MVILGAGGFAQEILQVVSQDFPAGEIVFYDDITSDVPVMLFGRFPILRNEEELRAFFLSEDNRFVLGTGNGKVREKLCQKAVLLGGEIFSAIDRQASIGSYCQVGEGSTILSQACISNGSCIGKASLVYYHAVVTHDCVLGDFVELSPGATLLGHVQVGEFTQIGANATVLSGVRIGKNCVVGAGAVVTKDVPDNSVVAGVPARLVRVNR